MKNHYITNPELKQQKQEYITKQYRQNVTFKEKQKLYLTKRYWDDLTFKHKLYLTKRYRNNANSKEIQKVYYTKEYSENFIYAQQGMCHEKKKKIQTVNTQHLKVTTVWLQWPYVCSYCKLWLVPLMFALFVTKRHFQIKSKSNQYTGFKAWSMKHEAWSVKLLHLTHF